jgi:hypothetical protein
MANDPKKVVDPTGAMFSAIQEALKVRDDEDGLLRVPTLDDRARLYLRAVRGDRDFGKAEIYEARDVILDAMAADVAEKLGINPPPEDDDETPALSGRRSEYAYDRPMHAYPYEASAMRLAPRPTLARSEYRAGLRYTATPASPGDVYQEDSAAAALEPEIIPPRHPPIKFSLRTIGTLSIMVCAAALIAGAGTFLFSKNEDSSLAWFAQPQESSKTEVASQSSGSKAALMPATVKPPTVTSESPNQQPSPEELAELAKRGRALLTAETVSRGPSVEVQAVASRSPIQQLSPEELAELVKRGDGLIGAGTASLLPSLAASQAVTSGSLTLASALAWYQNSKDFGSTESIGSASEKGKPN